MEGLTSTPEPLSPELQALVDGLGDPPDPEMTREEWEREFVQFVRWMSEEKDWVLQQLP